MNKLFIPKKVVTLYFAGVSFPEIFLGSFQETSMSFGTKLWRVFDCHTSE